MNTLIYFNRPDCPENMGTSQLTSDIQGFLIERSSIIIDPVITGNKITFTKGIDEEGNLVFGYAMMFDVPNDFKN